MANIAIVLHDLRAGGAEKMMVRLANQLLAEGDKVSLILLGAGGENRAYIKSKIHLVELDCERTLHGFIPLRNTLKTIAPDAVLSVLTHINVVSALVCFSLGWQKRLSMSERNTFSCDKKRNADLIMKLAYYFAPFIYRAASKPVIAVSEGVKEDLVSSTIVKTKDIVTAPNPVISDDIIKAAENKPSHPWLLHKHSKTVISVGRLAHQKGFDILIQAFSEVLKVYDCKLIIFGEGELRNTLQAQANDLGITANVSLAGYCDNPIAEIKAADLYVLSSRFEGSPNALVEAMSVNTPVLAFDCPHGPREILQGNSSNALVANQSVSALVDAMLTTMKSSSRPDYEAQTKQFHSGVSAQIYRRLLLS